MAGVGKVRRHDEEAGAEVREGGNIYKFGDAQSDQSADQGAADELGGGLALDVGDVVLFNELQVYAGPRSRDEHEAHTLEHVGEGGDH